MEKSHKRKIVMKKARAQLKLFSFELEQIHRRKKMSNHNVLLVCSESALLRITVKLISNRADYVALITARNLKSAAGEFHLLLFILIYEAIWACLRARSNVKF